MAAAARCERVRISQVPASRYDGCRNRGDIHGAGCHAAGRYTACRRLRGICVGKLRLCRRGLGKISDRTNVDRHQLHDGVQLSGSHLPDDLPRSGNGADQRRDNDRQRQPEYVVPAQLLDAANQLSDHVRNNLAVTVNRVQPRSATASAIESIAFSVAALPTAMDSAARWKSSQPIWPMRGAI
jgi:hypothetical protein